MATTHKTKSPRRPRARTLAERQKLAPLRQKIDLPMMRNSERQTFKSCRFQWWLSYLEKKQPIASGTALRFGSLVHMALADYYIPGKRRGLHPAKAFERHYTDELKYATKLGWKDDDGKWQDAGELGDAMLTHYVDHYGADDKWEVLVTEQPFQSVVLNPTTGEPWFMYVGVLDGVWRDRTAADNALWIPDHKTAAGIGPETTKHLVLDDQASGYWSFGVDWILEQGLLKSDEKLRGMLYNFLRKAPPDDRPQNEAGEYLNKDGTVSKIQPSPFFLRQPIFRDAIDKDAARERAMEDWAEMEMVENGVLKVKKTPGRFTCGLGCPFLDTCELHEMGGDWQTMLKATTRPWDPYDAHEIYFGR